MPPVQPKELKLTLTVPYSIDAPDDSKVNTGRMENSGLLRGLKDQATIESTSDHDATFTFPTADGTAHKFAQRFLKAKQGYLYDFDNNPNNGKSEIVTEYTVTPITDTQITKLVAAIRALKKSPDDWYTFFKEKGEFTGEQFSLIQESKVYEKALHGAVSFVQLADQLLRAYNERLKNPVTIGYWDDDSNLTTLNDLYWIASGAYFTAQPNLSALTSDTPSAAATVPVDLSESLSPVTADMITRSTNFIYQALLVRTGVADDNQVEMVPLDDKLVANNFGEFAKKITDSKLTIEKTEYRLPTAKEITAFKMAHLGANTVNNAVHYIGDENLRTITAGSLRVPVVVLHKSGGQCSVEKQSSFSANYNTGEYATLDFSMPLDMESDFFALLDAAPQAACVIDHTTADGKTVRKFRLSRMNPESIQGTIDAMDKALALKAANNKPEQVGSIPTASETRVFRAYELFADFRSEDCVKLRQALVAFKDLVATMVKQGEKPPTRIDGHSGILGLGLPVALEGLLLAAFLGVGGWFTHLLTKTDKFADVWQKMRSHMGYVPDYLEDWHDKALKFPAYDSSVGNREQVIRRMMEALANFEGGVSRSVMLIGESSQGKTAMMKEIARRIALWRDYDDKIAKGISAEKPTEYLNPALKTSVFYAIDFEKMGSEISLLGSWDHRVVHFKAWMKIHKEAVLYGDEATKMLGLGEVTTPDKKEGRRDLMNKIKEPVADGEYAMVLSTTRAEFEDHFVPYDPSQATLRRLHLVDLENYTVDQVKEILRNIGNQMVSPDRLFRIDDEAIDQLVDKLIENGTQEFLLLNTAKNMLIDVANRMREAIRISQSPEESGGHIDADMQVYVDAAETIDSELRDLLARKRQVQIDMHNLNNRISQTNVLSVVKIRQLKNQLATLADEYLEITAKIKNLTGPSIGTKLAGKITRKEREIEGLAKKIRDTPKYQIRERMKLHRKLKLLKSQLQDLHGKANGLDRKIVITAEMALAEEARQRRLSGKESHDSLVTEATALRQSIRTALLELRKYGHDLVLNSRADVPIYDGEDMADVIVRLKRLYKAIVTYNARTATNDEISKVDRRAAFKNLRALVALSGYNPALDSIPTEETTEEEKAEEPEEAPKPAEPKVPEPPVPARPARATPPPPPPPPARASAPAVQPAAPRPAPKIIQLLPSTQPQAQPPTAKPNDPNARAGQTHRSAPTTNGSRSPVGANPSVRPAPDASRRGGIHDALPAVGPQCIDVIYEGGQTFVDGNTVRVVDVGANPSVRPTSVRLSLAPPPPVPVPSVAEGGEGRGEGESPLVLKDMTFTDFVKSLYGNSRQFYEAVLKHSPEQQLKDILLRMKALAKTDPAIKALYEDVSLTYEFIKAFNRENPGFFKEPEAMLNLFVRSRFKDGANTNLRTLTADQFVGMYATRREAELQTTRRVERETLALRGNLRRGMDLLESTLREAERVRRK